MRAPRPPRRKRRIRQSPGSSSPAVPIRSMVLLCPNCGKVQPPTAWITSSSSPSRATPPRHAALEKSFYALAALHPDRFAATPAAEQEAALAAVLAPQRRLPHPPRPHRPHRIPPHARRHPARRAIPRRHRRRPSLRHAEEAGRPRPTCSKKPSSSTCSSKRCAWPKRWAKTTPTPQRPRSRQATTSTPC